MRKHIFRVTHNTGKSKDGNERHKMLNDFTHLDLVGIQNMQFNIDK